MKTLYVLNWIMAGAFISLAVWQWSKGNYLFTAINIGVVAINWYAALTLRKRL